MSLHDSWSRDRGASRGPDPSPPGLDAGAFAAVEAP